MCDGFDGCLRGSAAVGVVRRKLEVVELPVRSVVGMSVLLQRVRLLRLGTNSVAVGKSAALRVVKVLAVQKMWLGTLRVVVA